MIKRKGFIIGIMLLVMMLVPISSYAVLAETGVNSCVSLAGSTSSVNKVSSYKIVYHANKGSGAPKSQKKKAGKTLVLSATKPTRKGYHFLGWSTNADATEAEYKAGGKYKKNASVTLYAVWKAKTYYIQFDANGGKGTMDTLTMKYGKNKVLQTNVFTRKGYTFTGWNTKIDGSGKSYADGQKVKNLTSTSKKKVTLYAQWEANKYYIKYNANGGKGTMSSITMRYNKTKTLSKNTFTRAGYTFTGWNTKANGNGKSYTDGQKVKNLTSTSKKKITLYAQWKKVKRTPSGYDYSAYSVNDIVKYFIEIACDTEYSTGSGDYTVIQKWTEPIYYKVTGKPTEKDLQVLKTLCKELNSLKGFPGIYQAENGKYYNVSVNFWNCNEFYNNMGNFINYEDADGAVQYWYDTYGNYMLNATIGCRTDISQYVRNSVIQEEIMNGLGLSDSWLRTDSMVYAGYSEPQKLSTMDWIIVELLYHPDIKCGMTAAECEKVIRNILK